MSGATDLTGRQIEQLHRALLSAYNKASMTALVAFRFQPPEGTPDPLPPVGPFEAFTEGTFESRVLQLVEKAEREGWTDALVRESYRRVPGSYLLRSFYEEYFTSVQRQAPGHALQRIVHSSNSFLQPAVWREKLAALEPTVGCVEIDDRAAGTGFLVSPTLVLTNYHVMEAVIRGSLPSSAVAVRFDYKRLAGDVLSSGVVHRLASSWLVASSPWSEADDIVDPASLKQPPQGQQKEREAGDNELDYCFVRLQSEASADTINGTRRGFVPPPAGTADPQKGAALHILQHPKGRALELAIGLDSFVRTNQPRTRMTYRTNTEDGSSGSPCFDQDWRLVALHHSGDPDFFRSADYNEGIPIETIRAHLTPELRAELNW